MSLHSSSSVNREGSTPTEPLYKILDELRSLKLWKEKQERTEENEWERFTAGPLFNNSLIERF